MTIELSLLQVKLVRRATILSSASVNSFIEEMLNYLSGAS